MGCCWSSEEQVDYKPLVPNPHDFRLHTIYEEDIEPHIVAVMEPVHI
jgi:hypothetical protein